MALEWKVLLWTSVAAILLAWWLVPRDKNRDFQIIFSFAQAYTWLALLILVEIKWIRFPVREFPHASETGFTMHFLIYPVLGALLVLFYPEQRSRILKIAYYLLGTGVVVLISVLIQRYTNYMEWMQSRVIHFAVCLLYVVSMHGFYRWFRNAYWSKTPKKEGA